MDWLDKSRLVPLAVADRPAAVVLEWVLIEAAGWDQLRVFELRRDGEPAGVLWTWNRLPFLGARQWRAMSAADEWGIETRFRGGGQYSPSHSSKLWIVETQHDRDVIEASRGVAAWHTRPWSVSLGGGPSLVQDMNRSALVVKSHGDQLSLTAWTVNRVRGRGGGNPAYRIEFAAADPEAAQWFVALSCFAAVTLFHGGR